MNVRRKSPCSIGSNGPVVPTARAVLGWRSDGGEGQWPERGEDAVSLDALNGVVLKT